MPVHRRQAIGNESIRAGGVGRRSFAKMDAGTHAHDVYGGTVRFPHGGFAGTPFVVLTPIGVGYRQSGGGTFVPLTITNRQSGSFSYFGSPKHGSFNWIAIGSYVP